MNTMPNQVLPLDKHSMNDIDELRGQIDQIDQRLVELLGQRARHALEIGRHKRAAGLPVFAPERENDLIARLLQGNRGPLPNDHLRNIYREIISACREVQTPLSVAYLGPEYTFSHQAALKHFGHSSQLKALASIGEVFREVERGDCSVGLVPVENSGEGAVNASLDQLMSSSLKVCGEVYAPVSHVLMSIEDELAYIEIVYSHPQALAQCRQWLATHLPHARLVDAASTAAAARQAAETPGSAAVGALAAAKPYGLQVMAEGIQDYCHNATRFVVVGKQDSPACGQDKTSVVFMASHQPGSLHQALGELARRGINLTRIESRPTKDRPWEYAFFVDLMGHREDPEVTEALAALEGRVEQLKVLGSFPAGEICA